MKVSEIKDLMKAMEAYGITGCEIEEEGTRLCLKREIKVVEAPAAVPVSMPMLSPAYQPAPAVPAEAAPVAAPVAPAAEAEAPKAVQGTVIHSPLVGTAYLAPAEGEAPFVQVGDRVKKGQTLIIVEAMKLMNEIESECDGVVSEVLVENGQVVEYGQPLFVIA